MTKIIKITETTIIENLFGKYFAVHPVGTITDVHPLIKIYESNNDKQVINSLLKKTITGHDTDKLYFLIHC